MKYKIYLCKFNRYYNNIVVIIFTITLLRYQHRKCLEKIHYNDIVHYSTILKKLKMHIFINV